MKDAEKKFLNKFLFLFNETFVETFILLYTNCDGLSIKSTRYLDSIWLKLRKMLMASLHSNSVTLGIKSFGSVLDWLRVITLQVIWCWWPIGWPIWVTNISKIVIHIDCLSPTTGNFTNIAVADKILPLLTDSKEWLKIQFWMNLAMTGSKIHDWIANPYWNLFKTKNCFNKLKAYFKHEKNNF